MFQINNYKLAVLLSMCVFLDTMTVLDTDYDKFGLIIRCSKPKPDETCGALRVHVLTRQKVIS